MARTCFGRGRAVRARSTACSRRVESRRGARGRRRARASDARAGAPVALAAPALGRRAAGAAGRPRAASTPRRCSSSCAGTRRSGSASSPRPECSVTDTRGGTNDETGIAARGSCARPKPPYSPVVVSGDPSDGRAGRARPRRQARRGRDRRADAADARERPHCLEAAGCTTGRRRQGERRSSPTSATSRATTRSYGEFFDEPYPARTSVRRGLPPGSARRDRGGRAARGVTRSRPRRLRRDAARPALAGRRAARAQLRPQLRGGRRAHAARGRPGVGVVPARGRRRGADGRPAAT